MWINPKTLILLLCFNKINIFLNSFPTCLAFFAQCAHLSWLSPRLDSYRLARVIDNTEWRCHLTSAGGKASASAATDGNGGRRAAEPALLLISFASVRFSPATYALPAHKFCAFPRRTNERTSVPRMPFTRLQFLRLTLAFLLMVIPIPIWIPIAAAAASVAHVLIVCAKRYSAENRLCRLPRGKPPAPQPTEATPRPRFLSMATQGK